MGGTTTRREALKGALGTSAAGLVVPAVASGAHRTRKRRVRVVDVAVVGGGLSGLMAAREIMRAGRSVVVLEARDRVGGRTLNVPIGDGYVTEMGGQWSGPYVDRYLLQLAHELGIDHFPTYNTGNNIYYKDGRRTPYDTGGPTGPVPPDPAAPELIKTVVQLNQMVSEVPPHAPWEAPHAVEWDSQSFETWKLENVETARGRALVDTAIEVARASHPRDISLLAMLYYASTTGNEDHPGSFSALVQVRHGSVEVRFVGGSQLIAIRLAAQLGRRVILRSPTRRLVRDGRYMRVESDRFVVRAKRVIVAMSPSMCAQLSYDPPLPFLRAQLQQRFPQGSGVKYLAVYPRPFWRDAGLNGQVIAPDSAIKVTFDNSPPDAKLGVIAGFMGGATGRHWSLRPAAERRQQVLDDFASFFGDAARHPRLYMESSWAQDPWTRGCWSGFSGTGVLLDYGPALSAPSGRIHWAGSECAAGFGYGAMEGAIRAGMRTAAEALARL